MSEGTENHAREQVTQNVRMATLMDEEGPQTAALLAIAWALLDIANAIREAVDAGAKP